MLAIQRSTFPVLSVLLLYGFSPTNSGADEVFVRIHQVAGNRIAITRQSEKSEIPGNQPAANSDQQNPPTRGASRRGRGRFSSQAEATPQQIILEIPEDAKITSAMRERRTFEFRVGAELPGGLQNQVFHDLSSPLSARIVTEEGRISQINVITEQTDINQSNTDSKGSTVIAVRPKRPPMKK